MLHRITSQFQKEICPYCFEYFYIKDTPFRCSNPTCDREMDVVFKETWDDSLPLGKVLNPTGKFNDRFHNSIRCNDCGHNSHKRICPHCHMELPHTTGHFKNYIFAVIGAKDTGKSHYIAVLIDQIKRRIGPKLGLLMTAENDFTTERYANDFYKPIFKDRKVINTTKSATIDRSVQHPMVYSIRVTGNSLFEKNKIIKYITLVFFDTAGEDLNSEDTMSTVNKYIYRADGIILLIDPLQLNTVRNQLKPMGTALPNAKINTGTSDILNRTTRLIEKGRKLNPTTKINTPLAICFSKFDAVLPLIDKQFQLNSSAKHDNGFDNDDFEAINNEMESLLEQWGGQDIIHLTKTRYKEYGYFGLSALGCNPHDTSKIPSVVPSRVEDPFLWLLAKNGIIKKVNYL